MNFLSKIKNLNKKSVIFDDKNNILDIKKLNYFSQNINEKLKYKNGLVLVFSENTIEFLIGYYSFLNSTLTQMLLSSQITDEDLTKILNIYKPSYLYINEEKFMLKKKFFSQFKIIHKIKKNLILIYKKKNNYKINKKLALLI